MAAKACHSIQMIISTCLTAAFLMNVACSGGYTATVNDEKVYRADEHGAKAPVYKSGQNDKTTIHPMAKRQDPYFVGRICHPCNNADRSREKARW